MMDVPASWAARSATAAESFGPLPVLWDGMPVEWQPWMSYARTFICDRSRRTVDPPERCSSCGDLWEPAVTFGLRRWKRPSWPIADLVAWRCPVCGHDVVHDQKTGNSWDLEPEDYGPGGSVEP